MTFPPLKKEIFMLLSLGFVPRRFRAATFFLLGVAAGMGLLLVHVSRATSYLSDSPGTCINCHVMTDAYISWQRSSHGRETTCNDCHVPHTSIPREYAFKAQDGLRHAAIFTLRTEPQSICLSGGAKPVVQENCVRCHEQRVAEVAACRHRPGDLRCWDCHRDVPHGRVHSLSASPDTFRPPLPPILPKKDHR